MNKFKIFFVFSCAFLIAVWAYDFYSIYKAYHIRAEAKRRFPTDVAKRAERNRLVDSANKYYCLAKCQPPTSPDYFKWVAFEGEANKYEYSPEFRKYLDSTDGWKKADPCACDVKQDSPNVTTGYLHKVLTADSQRFIRTDSSGTFRYNVEMKKSLDSAKFEIYDGNGTTLTKLQRDSIIEQAKIEGNYVIDGPIPPAKPKKKNPWHYNVDPPTKIDTLNYIGEDGPWGKNASSHADRYSRILLDTPIRKWFYYDTVRHPLCGIGWKANGDSEMIYLDSLIAFKCDTCKVWNITAPDLFDSLKNLVKANGIDTGRFKR